MNDDAIAQLSDQVLALTDRIQEFERKQPSYCQIENDRLKFALYIFVYIYQKLGDDMNNKLKMCDTCHIFEVNVNGLCQGCEKKELECDTSICRPGGGPRRT
jgi:hypothetical protein